jgi:multidrug efflux pump subunit AcrB
MQIDPVNSSSSQSGGSISGLSISRHIGTLMLALAVIVVGLFYTYRLPVDLLPSITYPRIGARLEVTGIAPDIAVDTITRPLEEALATTEGVEQIYSQTREGRVRIDLYFQPGGDLDQALNDATAAVNRSLNSLPDNIPSPRLFKFDPSQLPVYEFALTSPSLRGVDLRVFADEELGRELTLVPGVANVDVSGGVQEEIQINVDLNRLQALGLGVSDVLDALRDRNLDVPGGQILAETNEVLTRTVGRFQTADQIRNLSFDLPSQGQQIYLRDFAEVIDGTEEERIIVSLNGSPAVKVSVQKQPDANTIAVVDAVKQKLDQLKQTGLIPEDAVLTVTTDESVFIQSAVNNVISSGLIGTGLAAAAVLLFLGSLRQTLIIILAIPLSTLAAVIFMGLSGLSLNVFSLGGLAMGVGIVVDNSIVMLETIAVGIEQAWQRARGSVPAAQQVIALAQQSSRDVESALLASTSTNLVAVLPFLLIGGFFSLLFNELILTISFAVAASILVALTVVPMLTSRLLSLPWSSGLSNFWPLRVFHDRFEQITRAYARGLFGVLRHRFWVIGLAVLVLGGGSWHLAQKLPQEILPPINTGQAVLFAQFPPGTPLATNREVMATLDDLVLQNPATEYAFTTSGGFLFGSSTSVNPLRGSSTITLKPGTNVDDYIQDITRNIEQLNLAGIRVRMRPGEVRGLITSNSPAGGSADIDVVLQGNREEDLETAGPMVLDALDAQATLATFRPTADQQQPEIRIQPDWERATRLGLTTQTIGDTIQTALEGAIPTQLQRGNRLVDVRVQLNNNVVQRVSQLEQIPLFTPNRQLVRLSDVANLETGQAPSEIERLNRRQVYIIAGNLEPGASLSGALTETNQIVNSLTLPGGVTQIPSSAEQTNRQLQQAFILLSLLAIFLVFVVMAVQYNSLVDPLVIILTVPLALAGGIVGLYVTNTALGATVVVGAVLLVGIVVNNAIVLVELANQIREREGVDRQTAMLKAAPQRLRPILMTTITTVLGLFPLALGGGTGQGSEFLQPLGIVVFSGLSLATLLTLFVIPCFYVILHGIFHQLERVVYGGHKNQIEVVPESVPPALEKSGR